MVSSRGRDWGVDSIRKTAFKTKSLKNRGGHGKVYARREVSDKGSNNLFRMTDDGCGNSRL